MAKLIFVNLPVADLARATAFYQAIGAEKNGQFCDDTASCMVFSETIHAMLLTHDKFRQFTPKKIADARTSERGADLPFRRQPRGRRRDGRQGAGRRWRLDPCPKQDYGFMYGRSFEDPDGHIWEVMWMDVAAATAANPLRPMPDLKPDLRSLQMSKISPCLWFDGEAEEAANFYVSLLPDSRIERCRRTPSTVPPARPARCWWWTLRWPASVTWR